MNYAPERVWLDGDATIDEGVFPRCFATPKQVSDPPMEFIRADIHAAAIARAERAETALAIAEEALRGAIAAIDAAYDGPDDNGAYTVRERAALAKIEALKGGAA